MKPKKVAIVSDFHCGHHAGLTHPDFDAMPSKNNPPFYALWKSRRRHWDWFASEVSQFKPDIVIANGDLIDGKGMKSGATELITADREEQCDMATAILEEMKAKSNYLTFGTPYHTGDQEDMERQISKAIKADKIGSHDWLDVNGLIFDYRHHTSSSIVPYGRGTMIARERLWNVLWSGDDYGFPKADVVVRSHVHYFSYIGGRGWLAMTTPALQGLGTKYGARRMSGTVDFGFITFEVKDKEDWKWQYRLLQSQKQLPMMA